MNVTKDNYTFRGYYYTIAKATLSKLILFDSKFYKLNFNTGYTISLINRKFLFMKIA